MRKLFCMHLFAANAGVGKRKALANDAVPAAFKGAVRVRKIKPIPLHGG